MSNKTMRRIAALCYLVTLLGWLVFSGCTLIFHTVSRASGSMQTSVLQLNSFELYGCYAVDENSLFADTVDSQMILSGYTGRIADISMDITFDGDPGEVNLYYSNAGEPFTPRQKIWGSRGQDGRYFFHLGGKVYSGIRIDPTSNSGCTCTINSVTINPQVSAFSYFVPSNTVIFHFLIFPGAVAAVLCFAGNLFGLTDEKLAAAYKRLRSAKAPKKPTA